MIGLAHMTIALVIVYGNYWPVDGYFMKIRSAQANELCIGIREQAALHQWIVGEINTGHDMAYVKGYLFGFGKEIIGIAVER